MMRVEKLKVDRLSLGTIMQDIERGVIRIPRFQRNFVWERKLIITLLDSMYKEYPIGTIFFWDAPAQYNDLLRSIDHLNQPPLDAKRGYRFILDGQQRLTSLYAVIKGLTIGQEDYSKIVVDLDSPKPERIFQYRKADNQRWVSVRDLLAVDVFSLYNMLTTDTRKRNFERYRTALNNYPFSVVIVSDDMHVEDAIEIFERINRQGQKLTRYDLIAASVLKGDFDLRERVRRDIIDKLKHNFGKIEETSIPQALALNIKGKTEHATQLGLQTEEVETAWDKTVEAFLTAVDFVRQNLGVARKDFLPYDAMLPVLAYYFYTIGTSSVLSPYHREQIEIWFWRTAFSERYSGASQTRMTEDAAWIKRLIDENEPYNQSISLDISIVMGSSMRSTTSAVRNGVLCLLNLKRPLNFRNASEIEIKGEHFSRFTRAERHHIFPINFLKQGKYSKLRWVHLVPNFCFIPSDLNKYISDKAPSEYMEEMSKYYGSFEEFERVMLSHLIPVDDSSGIWTDDYELFLAQRANLLLDEIRWRCGVTTRLEPEQRHPIVDDLENTLRDFVHNTLLAHGDYWKHYIPGDIQKRVADRIDTHVSKTPGVSKETYRDTRSKLDFCDVSDYEKIILSKDNWVLFAPILKNKTECQRVLEDFREFRNALKHNREIDSLLDHRFQAAVIWLSQALNIDLGPYGM